MWMFTLICTICIKQLIFQFPFCFDLSGNSHACLHLNFQICRLHGKIKDNLQNPYERSTLIYNIHTEKYINHKYIAGWLFTCGTHVANQMKTQNMAGTPEAVPHSLPATAHVTTVLNCHRRLVLFLFSSITLMDMKSMYSFISSFLCLRLWKLPVISARSPSFLSWVGRKNNFEPDSVFGDNSRIELNSSKLR